MRMKFTSITAPIFLLSFFSFYSIGHGQHSISFFTWIPLTRYKTTALIPKRNYDEVRELCYRLRGNLVTFSRKDIFQVVNELHRMYGQEDFWIGITRDRRGNMYWNDGELVDPIMLNTSTIFPDLRGPPSFNGRTCGFMTIMTGDRNHASYKIEFTSCDSPKKGMCQESYLLNPVGIIAVCALSIAIFTLILVSGIFIKYCCCRSDKYIMSTERKTTRNSRNSRNSSSPDTTQC